MAQVPKKRGQVSSMLGQGHMLGFSPFPSRGSLWGSVQEAACGRVSTTPSLMGEGRRARGGVARTTQSWELQQAGGRQLGPSAGVLVTNEEP